MAKTHKSLERIKFHMLENVCSLFVSERQSAPSRDANQKARRIEDVKQTAIGW